MKEGNGLDQQSKIKLLSYISIAFWVLWKNRNQAVFMNTCCTIKTLFYRIITAASEYSVANQTTRWSSLQNQPCTQQTTREESSDCVKITCDAAWLSVQEPAGLGASISFVTGQKESRMETAAASTAFEAEAKAILLGVKSALSLGLQAVEIISDCLSVIKVLQGVFKVPWRQGLLFRDIWRLSSSFHSVKWNYCPRASTMDAHILAQQARRVFSQGQPLPLDVSLHVDAQAARSLVPND